MVNAARSKQTWVVGQTVKVGFMTLRITAIVPTPGNHAPDEYAMVDDRNGRTYTFTPHLGLERT